MVTPFSQLEICPLSKLKARFSNLQVPLQMYSVSNADLETRIIEVRDTIAKDIMLQDLQVEFERRFPGTVEQIVQWSENALEQRLDAARMAVAQSGTNALTPQVGTYQIYSPTFDGTFGEFFQNYGAPRVFHNSGTPVSGTNGTFVGIAENGALIVDTSARIAYVNQGTKASPTWTVWDTSTFADYLLNPSVLYLWGSSLTIQCCLEDGSMRDDIQDPRSEYLDKQLKRVYNTVAADRARALNLLRVDVSLDGLISEFEGSAFTNSSFFES